MVIWDLGILIGWVLLHVVRHIAASLSLIYEVLVAATLEDNCHQVFLGWERLIVWLKMAFQGVLKKKKNENEKPDKTM